MSSSNSHRVGWFFPSPEPLAASIGAMLEFILKLLLRCENGESVQVSGLIRKQCDAEQRLYGLEFLQESHEPQFTSLGVASDRLHIGD